MAITKRGGSVGNLVGWWWRCCNYLLQ